MIEVTTWIASEGRFVTIAMKTRTGLLQGTCQAATELWLAVMVPGWTWPSMLISGLPAREPAVRQTRAASALA